MGVPRQHPTHIGRIQTDYEGQVAVHKVIYTLAAGIEVGT